MKDFQSGSFKKEYHVFNKQYYDCIFVYSLHPNLFWTTLHIASCYELPVEENPLQEKLAPVTNIFFPHFVIQVLISHRNHNRYFPKYEKYCRNSCKQFIFYCYLIITFTDFGASARFQTSCLYNSFSSYSRNLINPSTIP